MTDGMAWSGFDAAAANVAGGAEAVFRAIGVPLTIVDRPGMQATFHQYVAYFDAMARFSGDIDFGHRFGLRTRAARSGIPGHLIANARRFRDGLQDLARTLPTLAEGLRIELVDDRDPPILSWSIAPVTGDATQFMRFVPPYLARMLQAHRGSQWHPRRIFSTLPAPRRWKLHASQLGCPLEFDSPLNAIEIERQDLHRIKRGVDRHVYALLTIYADYLLVRRPRSDSLRDSIASAIRDGLTFGRSDLTFVARRLALSRRSLQRKIAAGGASYSLILDETRFELANSMLAHSSLSIGEIAHRLGYSELAAFTRAYRKRYGQSPRSARAKNTEASS
ncbi:MAG: AraC family transcriptional regulator ligand-binding domain-containing protein [Bradyrhizobium sp.]